VLTIPAYSEVFATDGDTTSVIEVADSKKFWPGSTAYIQGDNLEGVTVVVLALTDSTHIRVGLHPNDGVVTNQVSKFIAGQPVDLSDYTTIANATIVVPRQTIWMMPDGGVEPRIPTFW
jgi:hypothetical protein